VACAMEDCSTVAQQTTETSGCECDRKRYNVVLFDFTLAGWLRKIVLAVEETASRRECSCVDHAGVIMSTSLSVSVSGFGCDATICDYQRHIAVSIRKLIFPL